MVGQGAKNNLATQLGKNKMVKKKQKIGDRVAGILKRKPKIQRTGLKFSGKISKMFKEK